MLVTYFLVTPAYAQDKGLLGSILNESCERVLELDFDAIKARTSQGSGFCWGYFEAIIEQKQFIEGKDIFSCVPTYAYYDVFRKSVIRNFMNDFHKKYSAGNKYVRAFDLAQRAVDKEFESMCNK